MDLPRVVFVRRKQMTIWVWLKNSGAIASKLSENIEEMFSQYS